jgi:transcriptional regulator with XRE-family HTH domain
MSKERKSLARTKGSAVHPSVERGIAKLGDDLSFARRARQISTTDMAARMGISRSTLHRLEAGDPGVSLNTLAMALSVLGLFDRLIDLVAEPESPAAAYHEAAGKAPASRRGGAPGIIRLRRCR